MALHILGIRHHGVGSAKNILEQLTAIKPDMLLVEGPPEITEVLTTIGKDDLIPPVAIMVYNSEDPKESSFYPFAEYSPEWVAVKYANKNKIPVRALDLPAAVSFMKRKEEAQLPENTIDTSTLVSEESLDAIDLVHHEPLSYLAAAAGFNSGESWWDYHFEDDKKIDPQHFDAVMHAMGSLREEGITSSLDKENIDREAYMRTIIRQAQHEMYSTIVVVCGAWHAPALKDLDSTAKADAKILKALPKSKIKIASTWIPWTNARLSMFSGYGAGIYSPGWYEHQWKTSEQVEIKWLTQVAQTFRDKGIDISTSHVIEAYNLSRGLAVLRQKGSIALDELNEAVLAVMCMGDGILLKLIQEKLIVGNKLGKVPADIPKVPLQEDFEQYIKSLRLRLTAAPKQYDLDLRNATDLQRSVFFHRLEILEIVWMKRTFSRTKGTFKESWITEWQPEMMVGLIDKSFLGNTIESAAQAVILKQGYESAKVAEVAQLIQRSIPAELYEQLHILLDKINELSAISADFVDLMTSIPSMTEVSRYGNVRKSDLSILNTIVKQLFIKVFIGLPNACYGLDEDNSNVFFTLITKVNNSIRLYEDETLEQQWYDTLHKLIDKSGVHPVITGCVCRLLLDARQFTTEEADRRITFALSINHAPHDVAFWIEGFLRGNGMILIYDNRLWNLLYHWVSSLSTEVFMELLPLLRRAFSHYEFGERRQIGEKAKRGLAVEEQKTETRELNTAQALSILPVIKELLGQPS